MHRANLAVAFAAALLAGCASTYDTQIDGDVRGLDPTTPRALRPGVYDNDALLRVTPSAAGPHLIAIKDGHVTVGLRFSDEKKARHMETVLVEPGASSFHYASRGESKERLTALDVRVDAPGWEPVEQTFPVNDEGRLSIHALAIMDPLGLPPVPARPADEPPRAP